MMQLHTVRMYVWYCVAVMSIRAASMCCYDAGIRWKTKEEGSSKVQFIFSKRGGWSFSRLPKKGVTHRLCSCGMRGVDWLPDGHSLDRRTESCGNYVIEMQLVRHRRTYHSGAASMFRDWADAVLLRLSVDHYWAHKSQAPVSASRYTQEMRRSLASTMRRSIVGSYHLDVMMVNLLLSISNPNVARIHY